MKTAVMFTVVAGGAFGLMAMQMGFFDEGSGVIKSPSAAPPVRKSTAQFPEDLLAVRHARPVSQAAKFVAGPAPHRLVFLLYDGTLHSWQETLAEDWRAESVEETELVVFVSPQRKTFLSRQTYPNGAPPVDRFRYDVDVYIMEAKTGRTLACNSFYSMPRQVRRREDWNLTALGQPVAFSTVFDWIRAYAATGFRAL